MSWHRNQRCLEPGNEATLWFHVATTLRMASPDSLTSKGTLPYSPVASFLPLQKNDRLGDELHV